MASLNFFSFVLVLVTLVAFQVVSSMPPESGSEVRLRSLLEDNDDPKGEDSLLKGIMKQAKTLGDLVGNSISRFMPGRQKRHLHPTRYSYHNSHKFYGYGYRPFPMHRRSLIDDLVSMILSTLEPAQTESTSRKEQNPTLEPQQAQSTPGQKPTLKPEMKSTLASELESQPTDAVPMATLTSTAIENTTPSPTA